MLLNDLPGSLPNVGVILLFITLSSIIVLTPMEEDRYQIVTTSLPELSILHAAGFEPVPAGTLARDAHVACVFKVLDLPASPLPVVHGQIPLSSSNPEFAHWHLWHIGIDFPVILTTFICAIDVVTSDIEEIRLALQIRFLIQASELAVVVTMKTIIIPNRPKDCLINSTRTISSEIRIRWGMEMTKMTTLARHSH